MSITIMIQWRVNRQSALNAISTFDFGHYI